MHYISIHWLLFTKKFSLFFFVLYCHSPFAQITRMHSSRMRTACLLPVSPSMHCSQRGCTWSQGGVPGPVGCTWSWGEGGVPGPWGSQGGVPGSGGLYLVRRIYLVLGGVPGPGRGYLVPEGDVPGPGGGGLPGSGDVPGPGGHTLLKILPCPKLRLRAVNICMIY